MDVFCARTIKSKEMDATGLRNSFRYLIENKEIDLAVTCEGLCSKATQTIYACYEDQDHSYLQFDLTLRLAEKSDCNRQSSVEI